MLLFSFTLNNLSIKTSTQYHVIKIVSPI